MSDIIIFQLDVPEIIRPLLGALIHPEYGDALAQGRTGSSNQPMFLYIRQTGPMSSGVTRNSGPLI